MLKEEYHVELILNDVTETSVERPEKTAVELFGQEKVAYSKNANCGRKGQAEKYRNGRKRFALRFNLIAAIYNLNLDDK